MKRLREDAALLLGIAERQQENATEVERIVQSQADLLAALEEALTVCGELFTEVAALGGFVEPEGRSAVAVMYQNARGVAIAAHQGEKKRPDSKGRMHADDCTFEEPAKFPVCTCGTWPAPHLNAAHQGEAGGLDGLNADGSPIMGYHPAHQGEEG